MATALATGAEGPWFKTTVPKILQTLSLFTQQEWVLGPLQSTGRLMLRGQGMALHFSYTFSSTTWFSTSPSPHAHWLRESLTFTRLKDYTVAAMYFYRFNS